MNEDKISKWWNLHKNTANHLPNNKKAESRNIWVKYDGQQILYLTKKVVILIQ
jgi:hypothetical protein